jgi:MauM/NapG family ferredoxin protein
MSQDNPINRRKFFREGLRELFRPLERAIAPIERAAEQLAAMDADTPGPVRRVHLDIWLRPPGSLEEQLFRETCSRCGECVKVCPAQCIKIDATGAKGNGAPYIEAEVMPCVVCSTLECMQHCPSGALRPTALTEIDMGTAVLREHICVRTHGQPCTICVDQCPLGAMAIEIRAGKVHVIEEGCIGCGVCQYYCPTTPKAIAVIPKMAMV